MTSHCCATVEEWVASLGDRRAMPGCNECHGGGCCCRAMVRWLNKSLAAVHNKEPLVDSYAYQSERRFCQLGRETWTTKIKIRLPLIQA